MGCRVALQQVLLNIPALINFPPHFVADLGEFCGLFRSPPIELTGKPLASRYSLACRRVFLRRGFGKSFRKL